MRKATATTANRSFVAAIGLAVAAAALLGALAASAADKYPSKTVRLVVGFGAGGPTDIPARYIADQLSKRLGERVVVENKPGAAGQLATRDVLAQPADGYNLLLCTHFESINTVLYKKPGFKLSDLAPISLISKYYYGLALANAVPAETFEQFVEYAKAHSGEVNYATIGIGSAQEIIARQLERLAGFKMTRIPFRGGSQVMQEILTGRVQFYVAPTLAIVQQYRNKKLKILAVTSPQRIKGLDEIPTITEKGINYVRFGWLGICAPAGTPQDIIDVLNREIAAVVAMPGYRSLIENAGSVPVASTPAELRQVMTQTVDDVAATIREFGMQQD
jgi:tripartite-type tricarboxylate transporter receptor subunit TctC